jgi:predicted adenine nucleotide alpha hydrolase (AANH) superfamily ATPase
MIETRKLLLHACCGPCLIFPLNTFSEEKDLSVTVYYYNPNIHPSLEYLRRLDAISSYCISNKISLVIDEYDPKRYFEAVNPERAGLGDRCVECYRLRLLTTAEYASLRGYDLFSTTLSVSPYQNHDAIMMAGKEAQEKYGVEFVYRDFRNGFREAQETAKDIEMYRQPYCGCIYSENERYAKKLEKATKAIEDKLDRCGGKLSFEENSSAVNNAPANNAPLGALETNGTANSSSSIKVNSAQQQTASNRRDTGRD